MQGILTSLASVWPGSAVHETELQLTGSGRGKPGSTRFLGKGKTSRQVAAQRGTLRQPWSLPPQFHQGWSCQGYWPTLKLVKDSVKYQRKEAQTHDHDHKIVKIEQQGWASGGLNACNGS